MTGLADSVRLRFDILLPEGSPRRKVVQVIAIVLFFEGISVIVLYSYLGVLMGALSMLLGIVLMVLIHGEATSTVNSEAPFGLRVLPRLVSLLGGEYIIMGLGALMIFLVVMFNQQVSQRPDYGDVDMMTILMGIILISYPLTSRRATVETTFTVIFVGLVFAFLAVPQAIRAIAETTGASDIGNWYVTYMLAAPFAGFLNMLGIGAYNAGSLVTIQFQDGSVHSLLISSYCAGLYSFSIFLSAFISFILVFEKLSRRTLFIVVSLGMVAAYFGNLLRMVLIGVIGYYEGMDALLWAHSNVGWIVFLSWSSVFWYLIFRYFVRGDRSPEEESPNSSD